MTDDENPIDELTAADLFHTAYRRHLEGVGVRLCPRRPFEFCESPPCTKYWAAVRGQA
jgi:hypothetical protein